MGSNTSWSRILACLLLQHTTALVNFYEFNAAFENTRVLSDVLESRAVIVPLLASNPTLADSFSAAHITRIRDYVSSGGVYVISVLEALTPYPLDLVSFSTFLQPEAASGKAVLIPPTSTWQNDLLAMVASATSAIQNYVSGGGVYVFSDAESAKDLINPLFGMSLQVCYLSTGDDSSKLYDGWESVPALSPFLGAPATLRYSTRVTGFEPSSLPPGSHKLYHYARDDCVTVAALPYGSGWVSVVGSNFRYTTEIESWGAVLQSALVAYTNQIDVVSAADSLATLLGLPQSAIQVDSRTHGANTTLSVRVRLASASASASLVQQLNENAAQSLTTALGATVILETSAHVLVSSPPPSPPPSAPSGNDIVFEIAGIRITYPIMYACIGGIAALALSIFAAVCCCMRKHSPTAPVSKDKLLMRSQI
ncbi:hypothetical protein AB1Y20_004406 [Prymnesium parvum]|uniref:Uncharacterized protein n=1 Tax=Prymnesium parvum TaxID=97485 RepID=A0AB34IZ71_PRYPA